MPVFVSRRDRRRTLAWSVGLLAAFAAAVLAARRWLPLLADPGALRGFVDGFGPWAPVAFVALGAAQVVVAPLPGQVFGFVGGYLFGTVAGTLYAVAGTTVGSAVAVWLARRYGRGYVSRVVTPETLARFDAFARRNAVGALFLAFLVPGLPDDVLCFLGGLTDEPVWKLVAVAALGRAPGMFVLAAAGDGVATGHHATALALLGALGALSLVGYLARERVAAALT